MRAQRNSSCYSAFSFFSLCAFSPSHFDLSKPDKQIAVDLVLLKWKFGLFLGGQDALVGWICFLLNRVGPESSLVCIQLDLTSLSFSRVTEMLSFEISRVSFASQENSVTVVVFMSIFVAQLRLPHFSQKISP